VPRIRMSGWMWPCAFMVSIGKIVPLPYTLKNYPTPVVYLKIGFIWIG